MYLTLFDGRPEVSRGALLGKLRMQQQYLRQLTLRGVSMTIKQLTQDGLTCGAVAGRAILDLQRGQDPCSGVRSPLYVLSVWRSP